MNDGPVIGFALAIAGTGLSVVFGLVLWVGRQTFVPNSRVHRTTDVVVRSLLALSLVMLLAGVLVLVFSPA